MKKERKSRDNNKDLYWAFDTLFGYDDEMDGMLAKAYLEKHKIDYFNDTRQYGLFYYDNLNKKIRIDPKRFAKKFSISKAQMIVMSKRKTHYFYPIKDKYSDYFCNIFVKEMESIEEEWKKDFKPIIDYAIEKIKDMNPVSAGDYGNLQMGISGVGSASAWAQWTNYNNQKKTMYKKWGLFTSMYAQFFHLMVSRIEQITVKVLTKNKSIKDKFTVNNLYDVPNKKSISPRVLPSFKYHNKMYLIWNFIKHNSDSTYKKLKCTYPESLIEIVFVQGELAIYYVKIDEKLILELLNGTKQFFKEFCDLIYDENCEEAQWNYKEWFLKQVKDKINSNNNPLDLSWFDELD